MIAVGKALMLEWLAPRLTRGRVLPLSHFSLGEWLVNRPAVLSKVLIALGEGPLPTGGEAAAPTWDPPGVGLRPPPEPS